MSTCSAQGNIVSTTKNLKTFKRASARRLVHILASGPNYIQEFIFCARSPKNSVESSFQNSLRNFFRRLESHIAEAASWPERR